MGKSDKKVKSERINALRKQYDAFLEEDKKRKERNEYILNRLDKMRSCNALVSLHHAPNVTTGPPQLTTYNNIKYLPVNALGCRNEHARSNPTLDEAMLLKEIGKKYILIPKHRSTHDNDCNQVIQAIANDNTDWKSKYDILDQLKQEEKEKGSDLMLQRDNPPLQTDEQNNIRLTEYNNDLPVRDISDKRSEFQKSHKYAECEENKSKGSTITTLDSESEKLENFNIMPDMADNELFKIPENNSASNENRPDIHEKHELELQSEYETKTANDKATVENAQVANEEYSKVSEEPHVESTSYEQFMSTEADENTNPENANYAFKEDNTNFEQEVKPTEFLEEIDNNKLPQSMENIEYPNENTQEMTNNDNIQIYDDADVKPKEDVINQVDTNFPHEFETEPQLVAENNEYPVDESQIAAFDAEQREMFYSEETDKNYDEYNQAHTLNTEYAPNSEYQQNEEYPYYEGTQAEESFPDEINDHEETSQRYDQSYEQQYTNVSEEQQHQQESDNQQLHQYEAYDQTQHQFDQPQYEQENYDTQHYVEQQLDNEERYNENGETEGSEIQSNKEEQNTEPIVS